MFKSRWNVVFNNLYINFKISWLCRIVVLFAIFLNIRFINIIEIFSQTQKLIVLSSSTKYSRNFLIDRRVDCDIEKSRSLISLSFRKIKLSIEFFCRRRFKLIFLSFSNCNIVNDFKSKFYSIIFSIIDKIFINNLSNVLSSKSQIIFQLSRIIARIKSRFFLFSCNRRIITKIKKCFVVVKI